MHSGSKIEFLSLPFPDPGAKLFLEYLDETLGL